MRTFTADKMGCEVSIISDDRGISHFYDKNDPIWNMTEAEQEKKLIADVQRYLLNELIDAT